MSKWIAAAALTGWLYCTWRGRKEKGSMRTRGLAWLRRAARRHGCRGGADGRTLETCWQCLAICSFLALLAGAADSLSEKEILTRLTRPAYGEADVQEELELTRSLEDGTEETDGIVVEVGARELTKEEIREQFEAAKEALDGQILGDNPSLDHICTDLYLPSAVEGFDGSIQWSTDNSDAIDWEGRLGSTVSPVGEQTKITAYLSLQGEEDVCEWLMTAYPRETDSEQKVLDALEKANSDGTAEEFVLPDELDGEKLTWRKGAQTYGEGAGWLLLAFPALLGLWKTQKEKERKKERERQMQADYPEIITKLVLLLGTGLNLRKAVERIASDCLMGSGGAKSAGYEAIVRICQDMQKGVAEKKAYEGLGQLCPLPCYRRLAALLAQHLKKGGRDIQKLLEDETEKAYEMRLAQARILGEQASTKLLFPMILMLLIVFVLLMIPAWLSFGV